MIVPTTDTPYVLRVKEVTHFFCSQSCLNRFMDSPETKGNVPVDMAETFVMKTLPSSVFVEPDPFLIAGLSGCVFDR